MAAQITRLKDKVAIVTGSAQGIGRAIAMRRITSTPCSDRTARPNYVPDRRNRSLVGCRGGRRGR